MGGLVLLGFVVGGYFLFKSGSDKELNGMDNSVLSKYKKLTDQNDHTGAALVLANKYGTKRDVKILKSIEKRQSKRGSISQQEQKLRDKISNRLYYGNK